MRSGQEAGRWKAELTLSTLRQPGAIEIGDTAIVQMNAPRAANWQPQQVGQVDTRNNVVGYDSDCAIAILRDQPLNRRSRSAVYIPKGLPPNIRMLGWIRHERIVLLRVTPSNFFPGQPFPAPDVALDNLRQDLNLAVRSDSLGSLCRSSHRA